jgi:hypothetical protein
MRRWKETFIVNLWIESDPNESDKRANLRGSVEHLPTRRRLYFSELAELVEFLQRRQR